MHDDHEVTVLVRVDAGATPVGGPPGFATTGATLTAAITLASLLLVLGRRLRSLGTNGGGGRGHGT